MARELDQAAFSAQELEAALQAAGEEPFAFWQEGLFRAVAFDVVTSTNDAVKAALKAGAAEGFAACAHVQTRGYGRQGRTWVSPRGGIYVSFGLRPSVDLTQLPTLGLVVSMAVRNACASLLDPNKAALLAIKWPNDLVVKQVEAADGLAQAGGLGAAFQKLCGISFETCAGGVCLGIGVNVRRPQEGLDVQGKNAPAYLEDLGYDGSADQVAKAILAAFEPLYEKWCAEGFAALSEEYASLNILLGQEVRAVNHYTNAQLAQGCVVGVDAQGRLLLRSEEGQVSALSSGEVHLA